MSACLLALLVTMLATMAHLAGAAPAETATLVHQEGGSGIVPISYFDPKTLKARVAFVNDESGHCPLPGPMASQKADVVLSIPAAWLSKTDKSYPHCGDYVELILQGDPSQRVIALVVDWYDSTKDGERNILVKDKRPKPTFDPWYRKQGGFKFDARVVDKYRPAP